MQEPLGMTLMVVGVLFIFVLLGSASAALIGLTVFLVRRSRVGRSPPA
jgi:hypothetical protein